MAGCLLVLLPCSSLPCASPPCTTAHVLSTWSKPPPVAFSATALSCAACCAAAVVLRAWCLMASAPTSLDPQLCLLAPAPLLLLDFA
jgi:hypothetical protein